MSKPPNQFTDSQLNDELTTLSACHAEIFKAYNTLSEELRTLRSRIMELEEERDTRALKKGKKNGPNWPKLLAENGNGTTAMRNAANDALLKLVPLTKEFHRALSTQGYRSTTFQRSIQIALVKNQPKLTAKVLKALKVLLPFIKSQTDDDKVAYKFISIFEKTCSEHGVYCLKINEELNIYNLCIMSYGRASIVHKATDLEQLLTFVEKNCYYSD
jgi:hypothetical protein